MKIDFSQAANTSHADAGARTSTYNAQAADRKSASVGFRLDISGKVMDNAATGLYAKNGTEQVQGRTIEDCMQGISGLDMSVQHNYMAVMSNFLSAEDFAKLKEDGWNINKMSPEDLVTVTDQIKVELAKSGVTVVGYNDNIDSGTIDAMANGSMSLKAQIEQALKGNDLPCTDSNMSGCQDALKMNQELSELCENSVLSDESIRYMLDNDLEPTLNNIYLAQFKSQPYPVANISEEQLNQMKGQIQEVIEAAGLEVNDMAMADAKWLIENQVPLTEENLTRYTELKNLKLPLETGELLDEAAAAIADGYRAVDARLISKERVFNEIRLSMTTEANLKLLKSDFAIDTSELEKAVEELKAAEARLGQVQEDPEMEQQVLEGANGKNLLAELYMRTNSHLLELRSMPADVIYDFADRSDFSLNQVYDKGAILKNQYIRAGESYEALGTEVRSDLGDNIKKAFANVEDILQEMDIKVTEANKRAVRILGYNQAEITPENLQKVKLADEQVNGLIDRLKPGAVLSLIRDGKNPLGMSVKELSAQLSSYDNSPEQQDERYSEFLWKLEKNGKITPEEKESYIGIYRLFRQVEKSDGAVIGNLAMQGAELSVKNLLSALRTQKATKKGIDVVADESFAGIESVVKEDISKIDIQIGMAFENQTKDETTLEDLAQQLKNVMEDPEVSEEYNEHMAAQFREAMDCDTEILNALEHFELPVNYDNILAMREYLFDDGGIFKRLSKIGKQLEISELIEEFDSPEGAQEALEDLCRQGEQDIEIAKEEAAMNSKDFMELRLMGMQIGLIQNFVKRNEYKLPINVNGEETCVNLKLVEGSKESKVEANLHTNDLGTLSLYLKVADNNVSGHMVASTYEGEEYLKQIREELTSRLESEGLNVASELSVLRKHGRIERFEGAMDTDSTSHKEVESENRPDNKTLFKLAKIFLKTVNQGD